jgi:hypothetical protein
MSDAVDKHLDRAFASLDDLTARELEATADAIRVRSPLHDFAGIFRGVADARQGGWGSDLARFHLGQAVARADDDFAERIAEAEAPFWRKVREALRTKKKE